MKKKLSSGPLNKWWVLNADKTHVRRVECQYGETFDDAIKRFLDEMPRKPLKFLAMVKEAERRRNQMALVEGKRARGRERYLRRHKRPLASVEGAREHQSKAGHIQRSETVLEDEGGCSAELPNKLRSDGELP